MEWNCFRASEMPRTRNRHFLIRHKSHGFHLDRGYISKHRRHEFTVHQLSCSFPERMSTQEELSAAPIADGVKQDDGLISSVQQAKGPKAPYSVLSRWEKWAVVSMGAFASLFR